MSFYAVHDGVRYLVHTEVGNGLTRVVIEPVDESQPQERELETEEGRS